MREVDMTFYEWRQHHQRSTRIEFPMPVSDYEQLYTPSDLKQAWYALVSLNAIHCRLKDRVLISFVKTFGSNQYMNTFRGNTEQEGFVIPDKLIDDWQH